MTTLEAVYENVKALERQVGGVVVKLDEFEGLVLATQREVRDIATALRTRAEFEQVERERLKSIPERLGIVEVTTETNAETLKSLVEGRQMQQETREAWIGKSGFLQSRAFFFLFVVFTLAGLILLRAVDPATVTTWVTSWEITPRSEQVSAPARVEELSESH